MYGVGVNIWEPFTTEQFPVEPLELPPSGMHPHIRGVGAGVYLALQQGEYRGISLIRTPPSVGPYSSPVPRDLW